MNDRHADAAAVPDAGDDTLRERLIEAAVVVWQQRSDDRITASPTEHCAAMIDALLPLIRDHAATVKSVRRSPMSNERSDAISAYAEHIKTLTDKNGRGYNGHERTLLAIGYAQGWDAAAQAEREWTATVTGMAGQITAERNEALDAILRVRALHRECSPNECGDDASQGWCHDCAQSYPCTTRRALDGMEATP